MGICKSILTIIWLAFFSNIYSQEATCFEACFDASKYMKGSMDDIMKEMEQRKITLQNLIGCEAPDLTLQAVDGQEIDFQKLKGQVVVLNFWLLTCPPCLAEIPQLNELVAEFEEAAVSFIAITRETPEDVLDFVAKRPFNYQLISSDKKYEKDFCVIMGYPLQMIIDKEGLVQYVHSGGGAKKGAIDIIDEMRQKIKSLL